MTVKVTAAAVVGAVALAGGGYLFATHDAQPAAEQQWALVGEYCLACHNRDDYTAELAFEQLTPESVAHEPELFEAVVRKLRGHQMPPPGEAQPPPERVAAFVAWLEHGLDEAAAVKPNPGLVSSHRMNRVEYERAVESLLGVEIDAAQYLPADDRSDGFDNIAAVLKVSPSYIDQFISAARDISLQAVGEAQPKTAVATFSAPRDVDQGFRLAGMPPRTRGGLVVRHWFPADGEYEFDIKLAARRGVDQRHKVIMTIDGAKVFEGELGGAEELKAVDQQQAAAQAKIRARFENVRVGVKAGPRDVGITFVERAFAESDTTFHSFGPTIGAPGPTLAGVDVIGPYQATGRGATPSREKIFICRPADAREEFACAEEIVATLARRAYRGAVSEQDIGTLLTFYTAGSAAGDFDDGIRQSVMAILASPKFLYRTAAAPANLKAGDVYPIDDFELASRLSFFLWSQPPDDELLVHAADGTLSKSTVLEQQVQRLLADPRSESLVTNFAFQWLKMYSLADVEPNSTLFPEFDEPLRAAFLREMELFLGATLRADRPVPELLTSSQTFVNERLALHYGIPNVRGNEFRKVELTDPRRFGLFGKGAVLMATSYADRTSPVLRGVWILENILGTPPAAPPPGVETDLTVDAGEALTTIRARLEQHRRLPSCNACHGIIDPAGLALENFDAIGQWRDIDVFANAQIDAAGHLADGTPVAGPADLRAAILREPDKFVQTFTEKLLTFALGRTVEYYDMPAVRRIVRDAARADYKFSCVVLGIVASDAFRMRRVPETEQLSDASVAQD